MSITNSNKTMFPPSSRRDFFALLESQDVDGMQTYLESNKPSSTDLDASLKWACLHGNADLVGLLVDAGADMNASDQFGGSILHFAVRGNEENVVLALVTRGVDFHAWQSEGETLFLWACHNGSLEIVRALIDVHGINANTDRDTLGRGALHISCIYGQAMVAKYLLCSGQSDVNQLDNNGWTSLHYVSSDSVTARSEIVRLLIDHGADLKLQIPEGQTPLDLAYECGCVKVFQDALSAQALLEQIVFSDNVAAAGGTGARATAPGSAFWQQANVGGQKPCYFNSQDLKKDETRRGSNVTDTKEGGCTFLSVWRKIFQNDDVEMLQLFRDSKAWELEMEPYEGFQSSQKLSQTQMAELFNDCYENGIGLYSHIQFNFTEEIQKNDFKAILQRLSGLTSFDGIATEGCTIFQEPHESLAFIALITGRFRIMEELLRCRQFDIVPLAILLTLIFRRMEASRNFPKQVQDTLLTVSDLTEGLAVDALNRSFLADNSMSKKVTMDILDVQLRSYSGHSIIDLADKAHCTNFLCLPCCQMVLDERWYGKLSRVSSGWRWIIKLLPPLFLLYLYLQRKKMPDEQHQQKANNQGSGYYGNAKRIYLSFKHSSTLDRIVYIRHVFLSPSVKFFYHSLCHVFFLAILSYVGLYDLHFHFTNSEYLCMSFVIGYAVEEFRQFILVVMDANALRYFKDVRNWLDITAIVLTCNGFLIRSFLVMNPTTHPHDTEAYDRELYRARAILLTGLLLFYIRILFILSIYRVLGPKLKMIGAMLKNDLLPLLTIFAIFLVAFGVVFQGLLFPNGYALKGEKYTRGQTLLHIYRRAFYGMFSADYTAEELVCVVNNSCPGNIGYYLVYYIFNIFYVLIVNIMLVNLLIALFSNTVSRIDQQSTAHWFADRYKMVEEYRERSFLPPPINILSVTLEILLWIIRRCCKSDRLGRWMERGKDKRLLHLGEILLKFLITQSFALRGNRKQLGMKGSTTLTTSKKSRKTIPNERNALKDEISFDARLRSIETRLSDIFDWMNELLIALENSKTIETKTVHNLARNKQTSVKNRFSQASYGEKLYVRTNSHQI